jgi:hypothetical protein
MRWYKTMALGKTVFHHQAFITPKKRRILKLDFIEKVY